MVSLNYRLGALGFMVSVDDGLWGNYGLQVAKQTWTDNQSLVLLCLILNLLHLCEFSLFNCIFFFIMFELL